MQKVWVFILGFWLWLGAAEKPPVLLRVHLQAPEGVKGMLTVPLTLFNPPETIAIRNLPEVTEKEIRQAKILADGTVEVDFDDFGKTKLEVATSSGQGLILVVIVNGRVVYAPVIDTTLTRGRLALPSGSVTAEEIQSLNLLAACLLAGFVPVQANNTPPEAVPEGEVRQEAEGLASGLSPAGGGRFFYNEKTQRLEVRDASGIFIEEMATGTVGKAVDAGGLEYRISFGRDELDRLSVLVRPGPAMRQPVSVDLLGRKAVLSPESSLSATLIPGGKVVYEASICGEVYYIEDLGSLRGKVSRQASPSREISVLAEPASPTGGLVSNEPESEENFEGMNQAGGAMKSAFLTFFGLPDKQPTTKAKVYRLKGSNSQSQEASASNP